ncbi:MAG TPA: hypothetical protein VGX51_02320 [Solirubrobacteraceae bacterium]|jgi:hypothetical protein|nr:hypothetical protein [Solirubrobacteraceae bacterium]
MASTISRRAVPEHIAQVRASLYTPPRLDRYLDSEGRLREVVALQGASDSTLIVDRDAATGSDLRLVAHLAPDEPDENGALVCASYLDQVRLRDCRCRPLAADDFRTAPFELSDPPAHNGDSMLCVEPADREGATYRLHERASSKAGRELRWRRRGPCPGCEPRTVSVRDAIAALESYEPIRTLTLSAVARARATRKPSTAVLRAELARVQRSPIVLNRGLREAVLSRVGEEGLSMSEIALRCGRIKNDARGGESGETSWLARRLGLVPEGGKGRPTPWIHSDVLALIARQGLGISPREVELS